MPVEKPEIRKGRNTKDFGTGFYCTIIKEQAQRWAKRYDSKIVSIYEVRLNTKLKIKEFREMTEEWLDFIIDCRSGKAHDYDIVIGAIYETGAGPQGMIPYTQIRIYEDIGSEFVYDQELCNAINVELPEDATAEQVKEIIARKSNLWRNTNEMVK